MSILAQFSLLVFWLMIAAPVLYNQARSTHSPSRLTTSMVLLILAPKSSLTAHQNWRDENAANSKTAASHLSSSSGRCRRQ